MNIKELHESVAFRLALNKWAGSQPGYVSPVTKADVEAVMVKIRPQLKKTKEIKRLTSTDLAELTYTVLIRMQKEVQKSKQEPFVMPENEGGKIWKKLLQEKLIAPVDQAQHYQITDQGRKFLERYKLEHK